MALLTNLTADNRIIESSGAANYTATEQHARKPDGTCFNYYDCMMTYSAMVKFVGLSSGVTFPKNYKLFENVGRANMETFTIDRTVNVYTVAVGVLSAEDGGSSFTLTYSIGGTFTTHEPADEIPDLDELFSSWVANLDNYVQTVGIVWPNDGDDDDDDDGGDEQ